MATKNLARTVIEGGRRGYNKWERRYSHKETRADEKAYISEVKEDTENWYDYDIEPTRPVWKEFSDKLGPMYRWLHAQVGRLWNDVRSEVAEKFDTRTTAGRHITYDHLLSSVEEVPNLNYRRYSYRPEDWTTSYYRNDFYVDDDGYLRSKTHISRKIKKETFDGNSIANWLSGRVVGFVGNKLFWFTPTGKGKKRRGRTHKWITRWGHPAGYSWYYYNRSFLNYYYLGQEVIYKVDDKGHIMFDENDRRIIDRIEDKWINATPTFRQDRKLTDKEIAFWNTIPASYQKIVLKFSPTYVETEEDKVEKRRYYY